MSAAIFDDTSATGSNAQPGKSTAVNARKFTIASAKIIKYYLITMYRHNTTGSARVAIYTHNAGTDLPDTIVADSTVLKAASDMTDVLTQYQLDIASPPTLEAGTYWMVMDDNANASASVYAGLDTSGGNDGVRKLYQGIASTYYQWDWALFADDPPTGQLARPSSDVAGGTFRSIVTTAPFGPRVIA
jgi:hypothetical protein